MKKLKIILAIVALSAGQALAIPTPISHWTLDETSGTTAHDSTGGNDGTVHGAAWTSGGRIAGALNFDGTDDYVDAGNDYSLDIASSVSISAWVYFDSLSDYQTIVAKRGAKADLASNYALRTGRSNLISEDELEFYYHDGADWHVYTTSNANLTAGEWYHVAATFTFGSGTSIQCYINNNPLSGTWTLGDGSSAVQINTLPATIGGLTTGERTDGLIDDLRVWDEVLDADAVSDLYYGIPEPTTIALLATGGLALLRRRRR